MKPGKRRKTRQARGRPLAAGVTRYASGRIDYGATQRREAVTRTVTLQRVKMADALNIRADTTDIASPLMGSALGRLALRAGQGEGGEVMDAGTQFHKAYRRHLKAIATIAAFENEERLAPSSEESEADQAARYRQWKRAYSDARRAVLRAHPLGMTVLEAVIFEDRDMTAHEDVARKALAALAVHYRQG